ncbi:MAG: FMN-binding protein [Robiginitomaculum sp.]|nr:MAG: FMN-binding protein [Robiginitomaculum sp.]
MGLAVTCVCLSLLSGGAQAADATAQQQFIAAAFAGELPEAKTLWLNAAIKADVKKILRHDYLGLRVRYWQKNTKTVWVLEEIGKYKPITLGVAINAGAIESLKVLEYRESHGWEVKHDFFTQQFIGARLPKHNKLDRRIDGISGATLSVRALKKLARLALYFDSHVQN